MSKNIDERIVEMRFDNKGFESGVKQTLESLRNLKKGLELEESGRGLKNLSREVQNFSFQKMADGVDALTKRFSVLGIMGITAIQNITNSAINAGKRIASALTIDPIKTGFQEYETQINATQTILANTQSKGTTIEDVKKALDELNLYADRTIYNFTEMTRNIGTFTAAGVELDTSVSAIKGIANLAAVSGSTSQQASTAMYQLSQALASGTVKLMDWNSVVNAGMGGQVFQDALKETARVHGINIDAMIEKEGSFRETLKDGWLSADVLTETLAKFTGDMTEAELLAIGYTKEQAVEILKLGEMANDAATKVKTFTQLWDTLKEAAQSGWTQSWETIIGDFEEAKELLSSVSNVLGSMIDASSNARNEMLTGWKDLGGRQKLIEAFKNAFEGIVAIITPIREAFREIFPPMTSERLLAITESLRQLTERFKIGADTSARLKSVFSGLFSVVSLVGQAIKTALGIFSSLIGIAIPAGDGLLTIASALGDYLTNLNKVVKESGFFNDVLDSMKERIEKIPGIFETMVGGVKKLAPLFFAFASGVSKVFSTIGKFMSERLANFSLEKVFDVFKGGLFASILLGIRKFINGLTDMFSSGAGILDGIKDILDGVRGSLEAYQNNLKASTLMKIAIAMGILAASIFVLSTIDSDSMTTALTGMTVLFVEMFGALAVFNKFASGMGLKSTLAAGLALTGMATAILVLSFAMKNLSDLEWDDITKGLVTVGALMLMLIGSAKILSMNEGTVIKGAFGLIIFAGALTLLANAVIKLASLQPHELANGLLGVGAILLEIGIFMKAMDSSGLGMRTAAGILILAVGLNLLAVAVKQFGNMNTEAMIKGLLGLGMVLLEIEIFTSLMGGTTGMVTTAAGLTVLAVAMLIFSAAIRSFGSIPFENLLLGLFGLGTTLLILGLALDGMKMALPGAAALLIVAAAIGVLSLSLKVLASMSVKQIAKSLLTLVGIFVILGVAGLVLAPLVPILLGLGASILLLGVGTAAIGAGLLLVAAGLSAFAIAITAAAAAVVLAITTILGLVPMALNTIADMLIAIARIIGEGGVAIINAFVDIILAIANAIIVLTPVVIEAIDTMLTGIVNFIVDFVPRMVVAGMELIIGVLKGIRDNIKEVTVTAIEIVIAFIEGITEKLPDVIQAGFELVIAFINGLAEALRGNTAPLVEAINNLLSAVMEAGLYVLTNGVPDFLSKGKDLILKGLIPGVGGQISAFVTKIKELPSKAIAGISEFIGGFKTAGENLIGGFIQGIKNRKKDVEIAAGDVGGSSVAAANRALRSRSPSREFFDVGENAIMGLANGFSKLSWISSDAAGKVGQDAMASISKAVADISDLISGDMDSSPTIRPVLDMTNVQNGIDSVFGKGYGLDVSGARGKVGNISSLESARRPIDIKPSTPEQGDTYYNVEVNNPKPAAAPDSVRNVLLKHSYGVL